jgi:NADPH:quinone reductase-like Zn-dependent oxidoreductase
MHHTGLLITDWPAVIGCETSGVVVDVGEGVKRLKKGDYILGCTRVGSPGHSTYQETFLMSEDTAIRQVGSKVTPENASTIGVGLYVGC